MQVVWREFPSLRCTSRFCYLLLGWIGTLVVVGVQLAIAGWMVWAMIRAPD